MLIKEQYDIIKAVKTLTSVFAAFIFLNIFCTYFSFHSAVFREGLPQFPYGTRTYGVEMVFYKNSAADEWGVIC